MTKQEFSSLVLTEQKSLKNYAKMLTRNTEDAHDLVQETMLKAYANRDSYISNTSIKAWLFTIMKNSFINQYRRMVKRNTFLDTTDNTYFLDSPFIALENKGDLKMMKKDIHKAIEDLPSSLRETFMLHYYGYKYHELAEYYNIPIGTIKTRIHMARKALKDKLSDYGASYGLCMN